MRLKGQRALVTGGLRGIGRSIVETLAEEGADVAFTYHSSSGAQDWVAHLESLGVRALAMPMDVCDPRQVEDGVQRVLRELGGVEILVNNAGITRDGLLVRMKDEDWDAVQNTNLGGSFRVTRAVARAMIKQRYGRIVNISSAVGEMGNAGQANYAASKAALIGFTKSLARELASRNITVNAVAPGFVETDMTAALSAEQRKNLLGIIPLGRVGRPEEVARCVLFLGTPEMGYITGQVIHVNGGLYM
ncbi:MAG: 3-oxoacyl-ACP reductase FabG [Nitrospinota bacterium]